MNEGVVSDFSNRPFLRHVAWLVTALFVVSPPLHAWQSETAVIGKLIAAGDRTPIEGMLVEIIALRISARSDGDGAFRLVGVSPGTWVLTIQRIGFGQHSQTITVPATPSPFDLGTMTFTASPTQLADVVVEARQRSLRLESAGFYDRQKRGSGSFADRAEFYARHRPSYPEEMFVFLRTEVQLEATHVIVDLGSGTGILSEPFLRRGHTVYGVEPNGEMRAAAETALESRDRFQSVNGTAEAAGLEGQQEDR
ncbi:MAG: carboxypeptidase regulatory-like domain-containing protein, partial [Proteobacteria bacterium]|nr:carboxypeptidase regulatory-like domain-containing protein [Pseudomonadota bacterium]